MCKYKDKDCNHDENICWHCVNSVPNEFDRGCPWSMFGEPVEGWNAEPSKIVEGSFHIYECPMFREEVRG